MTRKDILEAEPHQAVLLRTQWKEVRGLLPTTGVPNDVMRYIEELEEALQSLHDDCLASDFNEHWESYQRASTALKSADV